MKSTHQHKPIGNSSAATQPIIVKSGNGNAVYVVGGLLIVGGYFVGKNLISQFGKNSAEADNSPEGLIAQQLKTVFDTRPVSDSDYRTIALQINAKNKADVYKLYRKLTNGRNLSDDIAVHITNGAANSAIKIQTYNSKTGGLFSITPDNKIQFNVKKGDTIRFTPGQKTAINVYQSPFGILLNELKGQPGGDAIIAKFKKNTSTVVATVSSVLTPTSKVYRVVNTMEVPVNWFKTSKVLNTIPVTISTKKVFAAVQILLGTQNGKPVYVWIDGRDMMIYKKSLTGIGNTSNLLM